MKKKFIKMFALATILGCGLGVVTSCGSNIDSTPSQLKRLIILI